MKYSKNPVCRDVKRPQVRRTEEKRKKRRRRETNVGRDAIGIVLRITVLSIDRFITTRLFPCYCFSPLICLSLSHLAGFHKAHSLTRFPFSISTEINRVIVSSYPWIRIYPPRPFKLQGLWQTRLRLVSGYIDNRCCPLDSLGSIKD